MPKFTALHPGIYIRSDITGGTIFVRIKGHGKIYQTLNFKPDVMRSLKTDNPEIAKEYCNWIHKVVSNQKYSIPDVPDVVADLFGMDKTRPSQQEEEVSLKANAFKALLRKAPKGVETQIKILLEEKERLQNENTSLRKDNESYQAKDKKERQRIAEELEKTVETVRCPPKTDPGAGLESCSLITERGLYVEEAIHAGADHRQTARG